MAYEIVKWVMDTSPYSGKAKLLHLALAEYANSSGRCWPSQKSLAARAGCSVEYVRRVIKRMCADGYVVLERQSRREGDAHHYRLMSPTGLGWVPNSERGGPQLRTERSPTPVPRNLQRTIKEPSTTPARDANGYGTCGRCGERMWGVVCHSCSWKHPDYEDFIMKRSAQ